MAIIAINCCDWICDQCRVTTTENSAGTGHHKGYHGGIPSQWPTDNALVVLRLEY